MKGITLESVLIALNNYQKIDGFEVLEGEELSTIFDKKEFAIHRNEFETALIWEGISARSRANWWHDFIKMNYLVPVADDNNFMYLVVDKIATDIMKRRGKSPEEYLGLID